MKGIQLEVNFNHNFDSSFIAFLEKQVDKIINVVDKAIESINSNIKDINTKIELLKK